MHSEESASERCRLRRYRAMLRVLRAPLSLRPNLHQKEVVAEEISSVDMHDWGLRLRMSVPRSRCTADFRLPRLPRLGCAPVPAARGSVAGPAGTQAAAKKGVQLFTRRNAVAMQCAQSKDRAAEWLGSSALAPCVGSAGQQQRPAKSEHQQQQQ